MENNGKQFFTADIHFCDPKSMKSDNRPFKNINQYDKFILNDWNKTAKKGDTIYVVGDILDCNGPDTTEWRKGLDLVKKVKANIVLIMGNNEERVLRYFFDNDFDKFKEACKEAGISEVYRHVVIEWNGHKVNLTHQSKDCDKRMLNFFGHTHLSSGLYHPYGLCVSTDLNHFRLFTSEILEGYLTRKHEYWEPDDNLNYINPFLKKEGEKYINIKKAKSKTWQEYKKYDWN